MICTNCGMKIEDGAAFCPECGAVAVPAAPAAQNAPAKPAKRKPGKGGIIAIIAVTFLLAAAAVAILVLKGDKLFRGTDPARQLQGTWVCSEVIEKQYEDKRQALPPWYFDMELDVARCSERWRLTDEEKNQLKEPLYKLTLREDGTGLLQGAVFDEMDPVKVPNGYTAYFTVDKDKTLILCIALNMPRTYAETYGYSYRFTYSKDAMDGNADCWYIKGDTLYLGGAKMTRGR